MILSKVCHYDQRKLEITEKVHLTICKRNFKQPLT